MQYFEDILPYEDFSIRLNNADLPQLREILRSVTDEEYRKLVGNVVRYHKAFTWNTEMGGQVRETGAVWWPGARNVLPDAKVECLGGFRPGPMT